MSWLVWGGFVRTIFVLHSTWLVNSATHVWGYRTHETRDDSTNLWWVALLTYGEGWHNNHHAFQTSARHGLRWWEVDMTYIAIWTMKVCRIAYNIKLSKVRAAAPVPAMARRRRLPGRADRRPVDRHDPVLAPGPDPACHPGRERRRWHGPCRSGPSSTAEQGTHRKRVAPEGNLRLRTG